MRTHARREVHVRVLAPNKTDDLLSYHPEGEASAALLLLPPVEYAAKVHGPQRRGVPPPRRVGRVPPPPPLLAGLAGEGGEHGLGLWPGVLPEVLVAQHVARAGPPGRVEAQEVGEEGGAGGGQEGEAGADDGADGGAAVGAGGGGGGEAEGAGVGQAAEAGPGVVGGDAAELEDAGELVDLVAALEEGLAGEELAEDAADAPHVDGGAVGGAAEEELGAAVPEGDDELGEAARGRVAAVAGHAEVGDLELAAVVEEEVRGLEVAVQDPAVVEVGDARRQLEEEGLDLGREEGLRHVLEDGLEVVFEELEDEEDAVVLENKQRSAAALVGRRNRIRMPTTRGTSGK